MADFEYKTDEYPVLSGKGKGVGLYFQPGVDIFLTDYIAGGYGMRLSYTNYFDVKINLTQRNNCYLCFRTSSSHEYVCIDENILLN